VHRVEEVLVGDAAYCHGLLVDRGREASVKRSDALLACYAVADRSTYNFVMWQGNRRFLFHVPPESLRSFNRHRRNTGMALVHAGTVALAVKR
jgi:hypothetical protein